MISSDLISGKLDWNSSITGPTTLSAMRGKGYLYKKKKGLMTKTMKNVKRSPESHLDNLVAMMKDKEVVPKNLEFSAKGATGGAIRAKIGAKTAGGAPRMNLDSIAAKYGVKTAPTRAKPSIATGRVRASRAKK